MKFERKHYIYILIALVLSLIAIDGTETIINYNNYTNGSSNGSFYTDISMNENNITEVTEMRNNGTLYTPYINFGSSKIELGTKFLGSPLRMLDLQITGMNAYYNLNMNNKSLLNCLNCANKTELNDKVNKSGDNFTNEYSRMNISRCGQNSGNCATSATLDAMNYSNKNYLFFSSGRYYDTETLSWRYTSSPDIEGSLIQVAGNQILFRFFERNSLTPKSSFVGDNVSARLYDGNGNLGLGIGNSATTFTNASNPVIIYNIKSSGAGYEYICVEKSTGKLINSSTACDLI